MADDKLIVGGGWVSFICGNEEWFNDDGMRHREDGPAFIGGDGTVRHYLNGVGMDSNEFNRRVGRVGGVDVEDLLGIDLNLDDD